MTEEQIERGAERMMDALDRRYLGTAMTEAEYRAEVAAIDAWARQQRGGR